jgi:hypothetical protein
LDFLLMMSHARPEVPDPSVAALLDVLIFGWLPSSGGCLAHAPNIFPAGYEFESGKTAIS